MEHHLLSPFWSEFHAAADTAGISVSTILQSNPDFYDNIERFYQHLISCNAQVNLTRITAPKDFLFRHILDSLILLPWIPQEAVIIDIGAGAGFPAIPLLFARADVHVAAVESVGKKCRFMLDIREQFGFDERFQVLNERSEILGWNPQYREQFNVATARAVASLPVLLELCTPFIKTGGRFIAIKGPDYAEELSQAKQAMAVLQTALTETRLITLGDYPKTTLLCFEKQNKTPERYPRTPGLPAKKPL